MVSSSPDLFWPAGEGGIGMKLVGGKLTPSGETGAFVGKIFKGGVMDNLGQLKEGEMLLVV